MTSQRITYVLPEAIDEVFSTYLLTPQATPHRAKDPAMYSTQVEWFLANQRQTSYDPATQTPAEGALESAQDYAMAEQHADSEGWTLVYQTDPEELDSYTCILIDALGNELTALGGVEAEASAPWYRAIRAELALEVIAP